MADAVGIEGSTGSTGSTTGSTGVTVVSSTDKNAFKEVVQGDIGLNDDNDLEVEEGEERDNDEEDTAGDADSEAGEEASEVNEEEKEEDGETLEKTGDLAEGKKAVSVKLADGRVVKIPKDAKIIHTVDGKPTEINLIEALNREAGERTIEQRLTELSHKEREFKLKETSLTEELDTLKRTAQEDTEFFESVAEHASEKPEVALALIAERKGILPGEVMEQYISHAIQIVKGLQAKKLTMSDIKAMCHEVNVNYLKDQREKDKTKTDKKNRIDNLSQGLKGLMQEHSLSSELIKDAIGELGNALSGDPSKDLNLIRAKALELQSVLNIEEALEEAGFKEDAALKNNLLEVARGFTKAEIVKLIRDFKGSQSKPAVKSTLGKQSGKKPGEPKKPTSAVVVKSTEGLARQFGLRG